MSVVVKILVVLAAIALFIISFLLNKKTKVPTGVEPVEDKCMHCSNALCKANKEKEDIFKCPEEKNEE